MPPADPWAFGVNHVVWLSVATLAFAGVTFTVVQKHRTDKRNELWSWISWALKLITEGDEAAKVTGLNALSELLAADEPEEEAQGQQASTGSYVSTEWTRRRRRQAKPPAPLSEYDLGRLLNVATVYRQNGPPVDLRQGGQN